MLNVDAVPRRATQQGVPCSEDFLKNLTAYDGTLEAVRDEIQDCIHIFTHRKGVKTHELSVKRGRLEMWPELERRIMKVLPEKDVWKRFKNADAYDDHLHEKEQAYLREKREKAKRERWNKFKDEINLWKHAIWNAQHGRFTKETALPYQSHSITPGIDLTKPSEAKKELILP
jgi:hypothetical protein